VLQVIGLNAVFTDVGTGLCGAKRFAGTHISPKQLHQLFFFIIYELYSNFDPLHNMCVLYTMAA